MYIAITTKGYPSRYVYGASDGSVRGILAGTVCGCSVRVRATVVRVAVCDRVSARAPQQCKHCLCAASLATCTPGAELSRNVVEQFGPLSLSCPPNGLNSKASGLLRALCDEYVTWCSTCASVVPPPGSFRVLWPVRRVRAHTIAHASAYTWPGVACVCVARARATSRATLLPGRRAGSMT